MRKATLKRNKNASIQRPTLKRNINESIQRPSERYWLEGAPRNDG